MTILPAVLPDYEGSEPENRCKTMSFTTNLNHTSIYHRGSPSMEFVWLVEALMETANIQS
jgi:hypothetical protein